MKVSGRFPLRIKTLSPISHGSDERAGNTQLFRRERMLLGSEVIDIPVVSGNALRGQLRRIAARAFCESVGARKLPHALYHFFFSGGSIAKGSIQSAHKAGDVQDLRALIPLVDLFGGAWGGEIIPGSLRASRLVPLCYETADLLDDVANIAAHELTSMVMYTRRDDEAEFAAPSKEPEATVQMIYEVETLVAGVTLYGGFRLAGASPAAAGLFALARSRWSEAGELGGMAAKGHGQFRETEHVELPDDRAFITHVEERHDDIRQWLAAQGAVVDAPQSAAGSPPLSLL